MLLCRVHLPLMQASKLACIRGISSDRGLCCRPVISPDLVDHATGIDIVQIELEGGVPLPGQWGITRIPWDASGQIAKDKHGWNVQASPQAQLLQQHLRVDCWGSGPSNASPGSLAFLQSVHA